MMVVGTVVHGHGGYWATAGLVSDYRVMVKDYILGTGRLVGVGTVVLARHLGVRV